MHKVDRVAKHHLEVCLSRNKLIALILSGDGLLSMSAFASLPKKWSVTESGAEIVKFLILLVEGLFEL